MEPVKPDFVGMNRQTHIRGSQFVKPITRGGSPHAEEAASKAMGLLGVPHIPVHAERLTEGDNAGDMAAVSPHMPVKNLGFVDRHYLNQHGADIQDRTRAGHLLLSDFIMNAQDRHGGNYVHVPGKGLMSIDHGESFHSGNIMWPRLYAGEGPLEGANSMADNPAYFSEHPGESALYQSHHPDLNINPAAPRSHPKDLPIDPAMIDRALQHRNELEQLAYEGTKDLPEQERKLAQLAMRLRLNKLEEHRPKNVGELVDTHLATVNEAGQTFGRNRK